MNVSSASPPALRPTALPMAPKQGDHSRASQTAAVGDGTLTAEAAAGERLFVLEACRDSDGHVSAERCMDAFEQHAEGSLDGWSQACAPFGRTDLKIGEVFVSRFGPSLSESVVRWEMALEDDGCGVVRAIGVRQRESSTLRVFEAMAPGASTTHRCL